MVDLTITAERLYSMSKSAFYDCIPDCEIYYVHGCSQMSLNFKNIAAHQKKTNRRTAVALALKYCAADQIRFFSQWLTDYFSCKMQKEIFELSISENGEILPEKMLEKALKNI